MYFLPNLPYVIYSMRSLEMSSSGNDQFLLTCPASGMMHWSNDIKYMRIFAMGMYSWHGKVMKCRRILHGIYSCLVYTNSDMESEIIYRQNCYMHFNRAHSLYVSHLRCESRLRIWLMWIQFMFDQVLYQIPNVITIASRCSEYKTLPRKKFTW